MSDLILKMELYLVRHAQTSANLQRQIAGMRLDVELTEHGVEQTKKIAERLSKIEFDLILCSPLKRTRQTLQIILGSKKHNNLIFDESFQERDWGSASGMFHKDVDFENLPADAEKNDAFEKRIITSLEKYYLKNKNAKVMIVTHSGVIRGFLNKFFPDADLKIPNVSLTVFKFCIEGNHKLILEPCDSHLQV